MQPQMMQPGLPPGVSNCVSWSPFKEESNNLIV